MPNDPNKPDLEGIRRTAEDVGELPVPRSIRAQKGETLEPPGRSPLEAEAGPRRGRGPTRPRGGAVPSEVDLRDAIPRAAQTPEQLARALRRTSPVARDPQEGKEAGPPSPGERGLEGKDIP